MVDFRQAFAELESVGNYLEADCQGAELDPRKLLAIMDLENPMRKPEFLEGLRRASNCCKISEEARRALQLIIKDIDELVSKGDRVKCEEIVDEVRRVFYRDYGMLRKGFVDGLYKHPLCPDQMSDVQMKVCAFCRPLQH